MSSTALAQTNYPEVEPNDTKAAANVVGGAGGLVVGDTITGNTTGASTTVAGATSADYFRVKTATAPLAIYNYQLTLTTAGTVGHVGTIRGLTGTASGPTAGTDATLQTSTAASTPARFTRWYGFGKGEEHFYRVTGTATTTGDYVATLSRSTVTPTSITGVIPPGSIVIVPNAATQSAYDTDFFVYDSNFNVIGGADDPDTVGVTLTLAPGTYFIGAGNFNTSSNFFAVQGTFLTGALTDFPDIVLSSSTSTSTTPWGVEIRDGTITGTVLATGTGTARVTAEPFTIDWFTFTVAVPTGPVLAPCTVAPTSFTFGSGGSATITSTVTPGTGSSTITSVVADLSAFGLSATTPLSNGGSGSIYSATFAVPSTQAAGNYPITITATDGANATGTCNSATVSVLPPGQTCAAAVAAVLGTTLTGNVQASTVSSTIPCSSGTRGLWYSFTAPVDGTYSFTATNTSGDGGNPSVGIFDACGGTSLACNNPCTGVVGTAAVSLTASQTVFIRVGACADIGNTAYDFVVTAASASACCNDLTGACSIVISPATCPVGTTQTGSTCTPSPCAPSGSCCDAATGACLVRVQTQCTGSGQTWTSGGVCTPNPCPQPPPPANDECSAAIIATLGTAVTGNITNSTGTDITTCSGSNIDVWFVFTPAASGNYRVTATPTLTTDDGIALAIFTACPPATDSNLPGTACAAQPGPGAVSTVTFSATAGVTHFIRAGAFVGDTGTFSLLVETAVLGACCSNTTGVCSIVAPTACPAGSTYQGDDTLCTPNPCPIPSACCFGSGVCIVTFAADCTTLGGVVNAATSCSPSPCAAPTNETCATATPLALNVWRLGNNNLATGGLPVPASTCQAAEGKEVWFSFTPSSTDLFDFSTCGSPTDTVISVFSGTCGSLVPLACDDDTCAGGAGDPSLIPGVTGGGSIFASFIPQQSLTAGTTYYIRLTSFGTAQPVAGGNFQIRVAGNAPANVVCCRGTACSLVPAASCVAPGGGLGASTPAGAACNTGGSNTVPCCYADVDKSGGTTVDDIFIFLNAWFSASPFSKFGGDGVAPGGQIDDIFIFLNAWFAGC